MKDFAGSPGTVTGLALRISQCVFAAGSFAFMVSSPGFYKLTGFCFLVASMGLQVTWSFTLALLDTYALVKKIALRSPVLISLFVVGDWVTGTLSLSAASACAGITILYFNDVGVCVSGSECSKFQFSVVLAFLSWIMIYTSSLIMFWLLASSGSPGFVLFVKELIAQIKFWGRNCDLKEGNSLQFEVDTFVGFPLSTTLLIRRKKRNVLNAY